MSQEIEIIVSDTETTKAATSPTLRDSAAINNALKQQRELESCNLSTKMQLSGSSLASIESITEPPLSPASSSSASQTNGGDSTFEPTIDMMVNDFDDEQTLTEEEALAELEAQDPNEEIATLREESEMPLEELLAKYRQLEQQESNENNQNPVVAKKRSKKSSQQNKIEKTKLPKLSDASIPEVDTTTVESDEEENVSNKEKAVPQNQINANEESLNTIQPERNASNINEIKETNKQTHQRRTHLMELYPENFLNMVESKTENNESAEGDYDLYEEDYEEDEDDLEYFKKTIMVGSAYQAVIPVGLSKYGDVLPYENEDKLIWEPSQVSEKEVEDYLIRAKEIRPSLSEDEQLDDREKLDKPLDLNVNESDAIIGTSVSLPNTLSSSSSSAIDMSTTNSKSEEITENGISVKDNEQALHLLVQCGYDFKEALRRKRLNAVPLTGSMSLWSEEECKKFEEGIQKYGKDFLKIRQNQVRTRSMRELVQFYYLWKKSERRDQDFADSDTVDHMDMYLNEGDYNSSTTSSSSNAGNINHVINSGLTGSSSMTNTKTQAAAMTLLANSSSKLQSTDCSSTTFQNKKLHTTATNQKNFSIMNENKRHIVSGNTASALIDSTVANPSNVNNKSAVLKKNSSNRRRGANAAETSSKLASSQVDAQSTSVKNLRASASCK